MVYHQGMLEILQNELTEVLAALTRCRLAQEFDVGPTGHRRQQARYAELSADRDRLIRQINDLEDGGGSMASLVETGGER